MAKLKYTNEMGGVLEFGETAPFLIRKIDGLGSPLNILNRQKTPFQDGTSITDATLSERELILEGVIIAHGRTERENCRRELVRIFNPKVPGTLEFRRGPTHKKIKCYPELAPFFPSNMQDPFQTFSIALICPNPYWQSLKDTETDLVTWIPNLEFPVNEGFYTEQNPNYWLESRIKQQYLEIHPSGTVYWEPVVKDKAVYNNGIAVELPIDELESVTVNGVNIPLDTVTVAQDGLSFTSEGVSDGDIVEYIYWYPAELTTVPTMQVGKYVIEGGIGNLPSDANGQVSGAVKGLTATNIVKNGDFKNGMTNWSVPNANTPVVANNIVSFIATNQYGRLVQPFTSIAGHKYFYRSKVKADSDKVRLAIGADFPINHSGSNNFEMLSGVFTGISGRITDIRIIDVKTSDWTQIQATEFLVIDLTATFGAGNEPTVEECDKIFANWFDGTKSTVGAMRLKSVSADETETSTAYVVAKDNEGKIAELRSLPNETKDEINVTDRKLIKRIGEKSNIANGMVIDFADMAEGGTYYAWNEDGETETGIKGDTLGIDATTLTYQLAEPEIILLPQETENPFEDFLSEFGTGTPMEFGYREINQIIEINNIGDVDCPIKVVFRASGDVVKPYIQNVETRELLRINKTLKMGDVLEITTEFGNKNVYLNGEKAHHYLDFLNSTWLQLSPGINLIKYDAEHGLTNLECSIYHTPQYLGV